jgi:hypothetical protein
MDMKKILQTMDNASSKPVEGSDNMKQFLSIVTEAANPHKVTLPVQMAMQHYAEPVVAQPKTIKEVKKSAMSNMLYQYYTTAEKELAEEATTKKAVISEQARRIADRLLEKDLGKHNNATTGFKALAKKTNSKIAGAQFQKMKKAGQLEESDEENFNGEYDDEAGMAQGSLHTLQNAVEGLQQVINSGDNLPEWCQEKISLAEDYLVTVWDYIQSEKAQGVDPKISEHRDAYQRDYDSSRTGFGRPPREDDEYVNGPDPETFKINCTMTDTATGEPRKRTATVTTAHGYGHAVKMALNMYHKQGYTDAEEAK